MSTRSGPLPTNGRAWPSWRRVTQRSPRTVCILIPTRTAKPLRSPASWP